MHPALEILPPIVVGAWLAFGLAAVGYGIWLAAPHMSRPAYAFFVGGTLLLPPTALSVAPALLRAHLGDDVKKLQDLAHIAREDLIAERNARIQDRRTMLGKDEELKLAKEKEAALEAKLKNEQKDYKLAKDDSAKLATAHALLEKKIALSASRHQRVRAMLAKTQRDLFKQRVAHAQTLLRIEGQELWPEYLTDWLGRGLTTEKYTITTRERRLVQALDGHFYKVELFKAPNGPFLFGPKQFTLGVDEPLFIESLRSMAREVLVKVRSLGHAKLLVRGRADAGGPIGALPPQHDKLRLSEYLPAIDGAGEFFGSTVKAASVPTNYHNDHLPMLRAEYIKGLAALVDPQLETIILEGDVKGVGPTDRRVDIFLYIAPLWPFP